MSSPATSGAPGYRHDLDGLRGIAIALVVLFHVYVGRVSGGVDVFLLLSGFFFLGSQIRNADQPGSSINPWWSIWRTLRRLYPALVTVIAACVSLVLAFAPELRTMELAEQVVASLAYAENVKLTMKSAEYGAAAGDISPLQHLWSMAVQFQFYVFAILVIAAIAAVHRLRRSASGAVARTALPLLAAGTAVSFAVAIHLHSVNQVANYYSTVARFWELGLGGVLVLVMARRRASGRGPLLGDGAARIAAPLGIVLIAATGLFLDGASEFPGPWTLLPLGGAALVILSGGRPGPATVFLESRPVLLLGRIAYSLYLWHWPLLIIAVNILNEDRPGPVTGTAIIAVSLALAWATHRFIEVPLQQHRTRPRAGEPVVRGAVTGLRTRRDARLRAAAAVAVAAVAVACASTMPVARGMIADFRAHTNDRAVYPGALAVTDGRAVPAGMKPIPDFTILADSYEVPRYTGCTAGTEDPLDFFPEVSSTGEPCVFGDPDGAKTMVLIGGSHSLHWFPALDPVARDHGWRVELLIRDACPAAFGTFPGVKGYCDAWSHHQLDRIRGERPDLVVSTTTRPRPDAPGDYTPDGYRAFWDEVAGLGIPILGFRDNPWSIDADGGDYVAARCIVVGGDPDDCAVRRSATLDDVDDGALLLGGYRDSLQVDFGDVLCDGDVCPAVIGNRWVYRDDDHLAAAFTGTLAPELDRRIGPFLDRLSEP